MVKFDPNGLIPSDDYFMLLAAVEEEEEGISPDPKDTKVEDLTGLITFLVALDAYSRWFQDTTTQFGDEVLPPEAGELADQGALIARRMADAFDQGMDTYLKEAAAKLNVKAKFQQAMRVPGRTPAGLQQRAAMLGILLPRLMHKPGLLQDIFPSRQARILRDLGSLMMQGSEPTAVLKAVASLPPSGTDQRLRRWSLRAAEIAGAPASERDTVAGDVMVAKELGQQIREIETERAVLQDDPSLVSQMKIPPLDVEKDRLLSQLDEQVAGSAEPQAVAAAVASMSADREGFLTEVGRQLGMSPDQEDAMVVSGKAIIAAGAGSGKTRVLAGKVVDTIRRLGIPSGQIIATSFSKKSAAELKDRVVQYGGPSILDGGDLGMGTTHSLALKLLKQFAPALGNRTIRDSDTTLIRIAMAQVSMHPMRDAPPAPEARGFFDGLYNSILQGPSVAQSGDSVALQEGLKENSPEDATFQRALQIIEDLTRWAENKFGPQTKWVQQNRGMLDAVMGRPLSALSEKEREAVNLLFSVERHQRAFERHGFNPTFRVAADTKNPKKSSPFWKDPANQFFNLGIPAAKFLDDQNRPIGAKRFGTEIGKWESNMVTASQAWAEKPGGLFQAVYCAYQWLKENDPIESQKIDFTDMQLEVCKMMIANPQIRETLQARFKVILVDEAQDLNKLQHLLFGLLAGYCDAETQQPRTDGKMIAETYCFIGDDKQCVARGTQVMLPDGGTLAVEKLNPGDRVLSYRNGAFVPQTVRHVVPSTWSWGYEITTVGGRKFAMSPNHKQWATHPNLDGEQNLVYLMHRRDLGFRVGVTCNGRDDTSMYLYGQRPVSEGAEKFWVLDIVASRKEALRLETTYSLQYGIPTLVYHTKHRKAADGYEETIAEVFAEFGKNGAKILEERHLSFDHPHWVARTFLKSQKYTIQLVAHGNKGSQVNLEVGPEVDLEGFPFKTTERGSRVVRQWFTNYREALQCAHRLQQQTKVLLAEHLSSPEGSLRLLTASALHPGMEVPVVEDGVLVSDEILSVQRVENMAFYDLDVEDASNFIANHVLTSNSIYEFRGARPEVFIENSDGVGGEFATKYLKTNYRSGGAIVEAANKLIAHNDKQIPMQCDANVERNGMGLINNVVTPTHEAAALYVAEQIEQLREQIGLQGADGKPNFGIGCRTHAEALAYGVELIKKGIPFRSKMNFFNDPTTKDLVNWLLLANADDSDRTTINDIVLRAHKTPKFYLDAWFEKRLQILARGGNYLQFLADGGWRDIYTGEQSWRNNRNVQPYTETLEKVAGLGGSPQEILMQILQLRGVPPRRGEEGESIIKALVDRVKGSPDAMDLLYSESEGDVTEEDIRALALAPIRPLLSLCEGFEDLDPCMSYISKLQSANAQKSKKDDPDADDYDEPAVVIDTVHGWKGLEAHHMYVPMAAGVFPHARSSGSPEDLASERRLAYVAMTRGQESVTILNPMRNHIGKPAGVSRFVEEACIKPLGVDETSAGLEAERQKEGSLHRLSEEWLEDFIQTYEGPPSDLPEPDADDLLLGMMAAAKR